MLKIEWDYNTYRGPQKRAIYIQTIKNDRVYYTFYKDGPAWDVHYFPHFMMYIRTELHIPEDKCQFIEAWLNSPLAHELGKYE